MQVGEGISTNLAQNIHVRVSSKIVPFTVYQMILSSVQKIIRNMVASCVEMDNNQQQQQLTYLQVIRMLRVDMMVGKRKGFDIETQKASCLL